MKHAICSLLLLVPISACAHPLAAAELTGLDQFQAPCPDEPPALSDQEALAFAEAVEAAVALPTAPERAASLNAGVLEPLMQINRRLRGCSLYERQRANGVVSLGARFNQIVRETR